MTLTRNLLLLIVLFAFGMFLAGCGDQDAVSSQPNPAITATTQPSPTSTDEPTLTATNTVEPTPTVTPEPTSTPTATPTSTIAPTVTPTASPTASPTVEYETEIVGVTFDQLPGFRMVEREGQTDIVSKDGGIILTMIADFAQPGKSLQEMLDMLIEQIGASMNQFRATDSYLYVVDGKDGLAADMIGKVDDRDVVGRVIIVAPEEDQVFIVFGSAIDDRWGKEGVEAFDALINSLTFGHPEDDRSLPGSWDRYQPRTLDELGELTNVVLTEAQTAGVLPEIPSEDGEKATIIYLEFGPEKQYPSRVQAVYTGEFRDTPEIRMTGINTLMGNFRPDLTSAEIAELFAREGLFIDGTNEYWMPVQNLLIPLIEDEFSPGDDIELLVVWMGATVDSGQIERIYLVNEFEYPE